MEQLRAVRAAMAKSTATRAGSPSGSGSGAQVAVTASPSPETPPAYRRNSSLSPVSSGVKATAKCTAKGTGGKGTNVKAEPPDGNQEEDASQEDGEEQEEEEEETHDGNNDGEHSNADDASNGGKGGRGGAIEKMQTEDCYGPYECLAHVNLRLTSMLGLCSCNGFSFASLEICQVRL